MMGRKTVIIVAFVALVVAAFVQAVLTGTVEGLSATATHKKVRVPLLRRSVAPVGSGSGSATNPPVEQPKEFVVTITNWCQNPVTLVPGSAELYSGSWVPPPPAFVGPAASESSQFGFSVKHDPFSYLINGTLAYSGVTTANTPWPDALGIGFAAVNGEWVMDLSFWTPLDLQTMVTYVGRTTVYNLVIGHQNWVIPFPGSIPC